MPNRLYDGILFKKPIIASKGTYLGEVVDEYGLGIVVDIDASIKLTLEQFDGYVKNLDRARLKKHCESFKKMVFNEQDIFIKKIHNFIQTKRVQCKR